MGVYHFADFGRYVEEAAGIVVVRGQLGFIVMIIYHPSVDPVPSHITRRLSDFNISTSNAKA